MSDQNQFLLYTAPDGAVKVDVFLKAETVWLTQKALAELFGVNVPAVNKHLKHIFESGELTRQATVSKMEMVRDEGGREVAREVEFYNLDAIIAVGYRVNSYQATQFRIWATKTIRIPVCERGKHQENSRKNKRRSFHVWFVVHRPLSRRDCVT